VVPSRVLNYSEAGARNLSTKKTGKIVYRIAPAPVPATPAK
jgi:hypothetical protein